MAASKKWIHPPALQLGDRIGIVAPAGPVEAASLDHGVERLREMQFQPVLGRHVKTRRGFLAGKDEARARDFMDMVRDPEVKGIVCARGGYGVNRILPLLDAKTIRRHPKVIVGSSDITLLLIYLNQVCRMTGFHGPMAAASFGCRPMPRSFRQFPAALKGESTRLTSSRARVLVSGKGVGRLAGGNLTLMCRSLGTPWEIETRGCVLLIEDVNEPAYRIDGLLWQLHQAGKLKGLRGVVVGEMVGCRPKGKKTGQVESVFQEALKPLQVPVLVNCPVGHGNEIWTLPMGARVEVNTKDRSLNLLHPGLTRCPG